MTTNGRSKILEYLYANSPVHKMTMAIDTKLAHSTLDKYMTDLRKEGYVKSDGNGYWGLTIEGRKQYETDPMLPANQRAKDDSRLFSISQSISYIEQDYYCQNAVTNWEISWVNPNLLLPIVLYWLKCTNQLPHIDDKVTNADFDKELGKSVETFINAVANLSNK